MAVWFLSGHCNPLRRAMQRCGYRMSSALMSNPAQLSEASAQFNLGYMYDEGQGVPQDHAEAVRWYRKATDQGRDDAQFNLACMYESGQGVPQDYAEAHMWLNLAASRSSGDNQKKFADKRESIAEKMTSQQIAEAQRRAREWKPKSGKGR